MRFTLTALLAIAISIASGQSTLATAGFLLIPYMDKWMHFFFFGLLATLIFSLNPFHKHHLNWIFSILFTSLFGTLDEFHQSYTVGRHFEIADIVFDSLGAFTATTLYIKWKQYRKLLEHPLKLRFLKSVSK